MFKPIHPESGQLVNPPQWLADLVDSATPEG